MSRIKVPDYPPLAAFGGWDLYQLPRHPRTGTPLWVECKLIERGGRQSWGRRAAYRLAWGVDAGRLRRGADSQALEAEHPEMNEAIARFLGRTFTVARLEERIGAVALAAERERVAGSVARRKAEREKRKADAAALRRMMS